MNGTGQEYAKVFASRKKVAQKQSRSAKAKIAGPISSVLK
jgi:hypothetical protein